MKAPSKAMKVGMQAQSIVTKFQQILLSQFITTFSSCWSSVSYWIIMKLLLYKLETNGQPGT